MIPKISVSFKLNFDELRRKIDAGREKALKRGGAIVRGIMRRSIKFKREGSSPVGTPPFAHTKSGGIRNLIYFEYLPASRSVVVGPALDSGAASNVAPVPGTLETGGRSRIRLPKKLAKQKGKTHVIAVVRPRPFAGPALEAFEKDYPEIFKGTLQ